jgi:5-formyltetrahydrofolate cyclo-ligase
LDKAPVLKKEIRALSLSRRNGIGSDARHVMDRKVLGLLLTMGSYIKAGRVLLYASYQSEVGTEAVIDNAIKSGKEVVLPKVDESNGCLTKHIIEGMHDVAAGFKGIPEPTTKKCIRIEEVDIIIVPGVAFSPQGARIGYGGGYYDRLLPRVKGAVPIVALAYEAQLFEELPVEEHDIAMDAIITPERIISCHG